MLSNISDNIFSSSPIEEAWAIKCPFFTGSLRQSGIVTPQLRRGFLWGNDLMLSKSLVLWLSKPNKAIELRATHCKGAPWTISPKYRILSHNIFTYRIEIHQGRSSLEIVKCHHAMNLIKDEPGRWTLWTLICANPRWVAPLHRTGTTVASS